MASTTKCHLLATPPEIRDLIFEFAAINEGAVYVRNGAGTSGNQTLKSTSGLMLVNHQVSDEYHKQLIRTAVAADNELHIRAKATNLDFSTARAFISACTPVELESLTKHSKLHIQLIFKYPGPRSQQYPAAPLNSGLITNFLNFCNTAAVGYTPVFKIDSAASEHGFRRDVPRAIVAANTWLEQSVNIPGSPVYNAVQTFLVDMRTLRMEDIAHANRRKAEHGRRKAAEHAERAAWDGFFNGF